MLSHDGPPNNVVFGSLDKRTTKLGLEKNKRKDIEKSKLTAKIERESASLDFVNPFDLKVPLKFFEFRDQQKYPFHIRQNTLFVLKPLKIVFLQ